MGVVRVLAQHDMPAPCSTGQLSCLLWRAYVCHVFVMPTASVSCHVVLIDRGDLPWVSLISLAASTYACLSWQILVI